MTDDERAAIIAAETFFYMERNCPGGTRTTAWRVPHSRIKAVAVRMAKVLDASAAPHERREWLNMLDDKGDDDIRSVNMSPPNFGTMSAQERLDYANKIAGSAKRK